MANKKVKFNIGDSLVIDDASQCKLKFEENLSKTDTLIIESGNIRQIDLTGVQLLHYMVNRAKTENKVLEFKMKIEPEQEQLLLKNGFTEIIQTAFKWQSKKKL